MCGLQEKTVSQDHLSCFHYKRLSVEIFRLFRLFDLMANHVDPSENAASYLGFHWHARIQKVFSEEVQF